MNRPKLLHVVGARPNFPKLAPVYHAAAARGVAQTVVHTGQHYDDAMSASFLRDLGLPAPDHLLAVGSGTHAAQTARIMERIEPVLVAERADWCVVYGDVNSTVAAALVAAKLGVRVAHVEAGLRSHDRAMPEEVNRVVTDRLAELLLTPSRDADAALRREGEPDDAIVFVGNAMVDTLLRARDRARAAAFHRTLGLERGAYVLVTLHRPSNVDAPTRLARVADALEALARETRVVFPMHPRTRARAAEFGVTFAGVDVLPPVAYLDMVDLVDAARAVVTDSGGLQEETTALGVPCFTLRENTERPVTITEGTNTLVRDPAALPALVARARRDARARRPEGWDGRAGERVVDALLARSLPHSVTPSTAPAEAVPSHAI